MASFSVPAVENLEFEIPDGKGKTVIITVPPFDSFAPTDVVAMNKAIEETPEDTPNILHPGKNAEAMIRHIMCYFNPSQKSRDAIMALSPRQITMINSHWEEVSGITAGKSEASTTSSSETKASSKE